MKKHAKNSILSSPIRPYTDWSMMIIGFFAVVLLVALWSGYLFWSSESGASFDPFGASSRVIKKSKADQSREYFEGRAAAGATSTPAFVDPSL